MTISSSIVCFPSSLSLACQQFDQFLFGAVDGWAKIISASYCCLVLYDYTRSINSTPCSATGGINGTNNFLYWRLRELMLLAIKISSAAQLIQGI